MAQGKTGARRARALLSAGSLVVMSALVVILLASCVQQGGSSDSAFSSDSPGARKTATSLAGKEPFRWGVIAPLTGPAAGAGLQQKTIVEIAVEDINRSGGANGYPVEVVVDDSPLDPAQAVTSTRKQIEQDKVPVIFGPFSNDELEAAAAIGVQSKVVMINVSAGASGLHKNAQPYGIGFRPTDEMSADRAMKSFKKQWTNVHTVVVAYDDRESSTRRIGAEVWPAAAKAHGLAVMALLPFSEQADVGALVGRIKSSGADAVFISSLDADAAALAREYMRQKVGLPVLGTASMATGDFLSTAGKDAEGWLVEDVVSWQNRPEPTVQSVAKRAVAMLQQEKPGASTTFPASSAGMYDAMLVTRDIFNRMKITPEMPVEQQRQLVSDGWQQLRTYDGILGHYEMTPDGADLSRGVAWVRDGQFVAAR